MSSGPRRRKIAVLGSRSVGKSSLVKQFVENQFIDSYYPTIEVAYVKNIVYKGNEFVLEIFDTAGQDEYTPINSQHAIGIHGYVLVYSIASRISFEMIQIIYDKIIDFTGLTEVPCVVVGAKSDLESSRQVDIPEAQRLAQSIKAAWVEASAKNDINVGRAFELCVHEIERRNAPNQHEAKTSRCVTM
ncbi:rheb small monomeric gtpase [Moniliophthora roreri MCA 2997]|uniref:Rheb small monomeric gtpase n=1 Tax=Moniliophthora roreri (strain MCA 2997) TaxID=1381753 RepID=V2YF74_MONRO|nr:rheb small monomeric gtpase [Moniliophthora roreri MCA 2997]